MKKHFFYFVPILLYFSHTVESQNDTAGLHYDGSVHGQKKEADNSNNYEPAPGGVFFPIGTVHCLSGGTEVVSVVNPVTGRTWMNRNLGASRQARCSEDSLAYGDLYQWGRFSDGHQCRNSDTTSHLSNSERPGHGKFIITNNPPNDWIYPKNDSLWEGINANNNPCPNGYRLPSAFEWNTERYSWSPENATGAYKSPLKLPMAGVRLLNGEITITTGTYWSGTAVSGFAGAWGTGFGIEFAGYRFSPRAFGRSVRCIKD